MGRTLLSAPHKAKTAPPRFVTLLYGFDPRVGEGRAIRRERRLNLSIGNFCRLLKNLHEHSSRQLPRLGVLIRRMVTRQ